MIRKIQSKQLFIGDAITARDLKLVYDHGITAVLDLAVDERPAVLGRDIIYCRFPLSDDGSNDDAIISAAIMCLMSMVQRNFTTLVACSAGMSRSPLVVAAALSLLSNQTLAECLAQTIQDSPHDVSPTLYKSVSGVVTALSR